MTEAETPASRHPWKRTAWLATGAALLLLAVVIFRFRRTPFQWNLFLATFTGVDWRWLCLAILLILLTYFGRALRWEIMLRPLTRDASLWRLTTATAIGFTAVVLLGRAGELVRPYLISIRERVPFSSQLAAWLLERILDLLVVLLIFGFALTRIPADSAHHGAGLTWILQAGGYLVAGLGALSVLLLVVFRSYSDLAQRRIVSAIAFLPEKRRRRIELMLAAFAQGMESTRNRAFLLLLLLYTLIEWLIISGSYYCIFRAFPTTASFTFIDVVVFLGFVAFGSIIQIPGIGGGMQVVAIVVLTEIFGLALESATGLALLIWILTFVVVMPFGLLCAFHEGFNWRKFKHLPKEVPL